MEGWISIHRGIKDHWIWKSDKRLKWWIDLLISVNHEDNTVFIQGNKIECKRGQSIRSLSSWGEDWDVTKKAVRDFFMLLQRDEMITLESISIGKHKSKHITTRITVCNYDNYQQSGKRKGNAKVPQTIKENSIINNPILHTWRDDLNIYLEQCRAGYEKFHEDPTNIELQEYLNPGVNVPLSIEKGFRTFWHTERGWMHKKKSKTKEIDWHSTIVNSIGVNKVYKQKQHSL